MQEKNVERENSIKDFFPLNPIDNINCMEKDLLLLNKNNNNNKELSNEWKAENKIIVDRGFFIRKDGFVDEYLKATADELPINEMNE